MNPETIAMQNRTRNKRKAFDGIIAIIIKASSPDEAIIAVTSAEKFISRCAYSATACKIHLNILELSPEMQQTKPAKKIFFKRFAPSAFGLNGQIFDQQHHDHNK